MSRPPAPAGTPRLGRRHVLLSLLVLVLAVLVYLNTLGNGFVFDDRTIVERSPLVQSPGGLGRVFVTPYWTGEGRANRLYRPITMLSYALNRMVTGPGPAGFHAVNALLHGAATLLLLLLLLRLFRNREMALAASALFAVHPVLTESVASLVGRAEILSSCFLLSALLLDRAAGPRGRTAAGSQVCFFLALLSKENALAYPALMLLTDALLGAPPGVSRRRRTGEVLGILAAAGTYLLLRRAVLGSLMEIPSIPEVDNPLVAVAGWRRILTALSLAGRYLGLILFPARLSADYSAKQIEAVEGIQDPAAWLGLALAAGAIVLFLVSRRRLIPLAWGEGFALLSFFLVSNVPFPIGTVFAERLLYLPMAGFCAVAGFMASVVASKRPRMTGVAGAALLAMLSVRTWERNRDWKNDFTLFRAAADVSPRSAKVRYNLGNAYRRRRDLLRAEEQYRSCLLLYPDFEAARRNLAVTLSDLGRGSEAIGLLREALAKSPGSASLHVNLGNAYRSLDRNAEAQGEYRRALELDPGSADAHNNLGTLYHAQGEASRAEVEYREAVRLDPDRIPFRVNLGNFLIQRGDPAAAALVFQEALSMDPSLPELHRGLGEALLGEGSLPRAEEELERSLSLDPSQWEAPALLGYLYQRRGRKEEAIRAYDSSLARNPDQPEVHRNLAVLYAQTSGGREKALEHLRRCLALKPAPDLEAQARSLLEDLERGKSSPEN